MVTVTPYEALVQSASQLTDPDAFGDFDDGNVSAASGLLERNRAALESARYALSQRCAVPVRYEESFFSDHGDDVSHLRNLARAFRAEALLAASTGDYGAAALIGIDMLELGNATRRGGLLIDLLIGIAISGMALNTLRKIRTNLDHATRRTLMDDLQRIEEERESFADIVARDREWELAVGYEDEPCDFTLQDMGAPEECGLSECEQKELLDVLQHMADLPESDQRKMQLDQDHHILALLRMLVADLALRSWCETSDAFPHDLTLLAPGFLPTLPLDPYTNESFIYRPVGDTSFLLYSTGPKAFDGGGEFGPWPSIAAGCADLCLDADDYWQDCCRMPDHEGIIARLRSKLQTWWRRWRA
jgi:hypothetical protein